MSVVIDASAIVAVALEETDSELIGATRRTLRSGGYAGPAIMPVEVAGAIAMAEWTCRRSSADTDAAWRLAGEIIRSTELSATSDQDGLFALCRRHRLGGADASYLKLCIDRSFSLLTGDKTLASAARAVGVPLIHDPSR